MSSYAEYELERNRRREIQMQNLREIVMSHYKRYEKLYDQLVQFDALKNIPEEMSSLKEMMSAVLTNLQSNPEQAKYHSLEVGDYIYRVIELNKSVKSELKMNQEIRQRLVKEEAIILEKKKVEKFDAIWRSWDDEGVVSFAMGDLQKLKNQLNDINEQQIENQLHSIHQQSTKQLLEWKAQKAEKIEIQAIKAQVEDEINYLNDSKTEDNKASVQALLQELKLIASSDVVTKEQVQSIQEKTIEKFALDEIRKELILSIYKEIQKLGFGIVKAPHVVNTNGEEQVQFAAKKPSGQVMYCTVKVNGNIAWKFDGYEGQACQGDISQLKEQLQQAYGFNLDEKAVYWENPDKISKGAVNSTDYLRK